MPRRRPATALSLALLAAVAVGTAGCSDDDGPAPSASSTSAPPTTSTSSPPTPPPTEGYEDETPPPDAGFPASIADDSGAAQEGATEDDDGMWITGLRLTSQNGYDRLVIDLHGDDVPDWTARYTEASTPAGETVALSGDAFLRIALFTQGEPEDQAPAAVLGEGGLVAEVRATGYFAGYQEVLIGVQGGAAPFRAFALNDPARLVVDLRPAV